MPIKVTNQLLFMTMQDLATWLSLRPFLWVKVTKRQLEQREHHEHCLSATETETWARKRNETM